MPLTPRCFKPPYAFAGDGKLGLLVAQVLASQAPGRVTLLGRHAAKMALVSGLKEAVVAGEAAAQERAGQFDLAVEATGGWSKGRGQGP